MAKIYGPIWLPFYILFSEATIVGRFFNLGAGNGNRTRITSLENLSINHYTIPANFSIIITENYIFYRGGYFEKQKCFHSEGFFYG